MGLGPPPTRRERQSILHGHAAGHAGLQPRNRDGGDDLPRLARAAAAAAPRGCHPGHPWLASACWNGSPRGRHTAASSPAGSPAHWAHWPPTPSWSMPTCWCGRRRTGAELAAAIACQTSLKLDLDVDRAAAAATVPSLTPEEAALQREALGLLQEHRGTLPPENYPLAWNLLAAGLVRPASKPHDRPEPLTPAPTRLPSPGPGDPACWPAAKTSARPRDRVVGHSEQARLHRAVREHVQTGLGLARQHRGAIERARIASCRAIRPMAWPRSSAGLLAVLDGAPPEGPLRRVALPHRPAAPAA